MTELLANFLLGTRSRLLDSCHQLDIDINKISEDTLSVAQCVSCNIWANKLTGMVYDEEGMHLCKFCHDIDSLRF